MAAQCGQYNSTWFQNPLNCAEVWKNRSLLQHQPGFETGSRQEMKTSDYFRRGFWLERPLFDVRSPWVIVGLSAADCSFSHQEEIWPVVLAT
jgi:hypothetical protein